MRRRRAPGRRGLIVVVALAACGSDTPAADSVAATPIGSPTAPSPAPSTEATTVTEVTTPTTETTTAATSTTTTAPPSPSSSSVADRDDADDDAGDDDAGDDDPGEEDPMPTTTTTGPAGGPDDARPAIVEDAIADLRGMLGDPDAEIEVVSVEEVDWPDGSIGCPQPGMVYTQAIVNGSRIVLRHAGVEYAYHQGGRRDVFHCPAKRSPTPPSSPPRDLDV